MPELLRTRSTQDTIDRGLGIYRLREMACRPELVGTERETREDEESITVTYHTPVGKDSPRLVYTEAMRKAGISASWIAEHVIKRPEDYVVVGYIFNRIKVHPAYDDYLEYEKTVGEKGLVVT